MITKEIQYLQMMVPLTENFKAKFENLGPQEFFTQIIKNKLRSSANGELEFI